MKKLAVIFPVLMLAFVVMQGTASAKSISGKIANIDAAANSLSVSQSNPATGAEENLNFSVSADTTFAGVKALAELKAGDQVSVDAEQDAATGSWKATSISTEAAAPAKTEAAAPAAQ